MRSLILRTLPVLSILTVFFGPGQAQRNQNPFAPPGATIHYAPDRTCDLQNLEVWIDVNWPNRTFTGKTVNTLAALRNGLTEIMLHAGTSLEIKSVKLDGAAAKYRRDGRKVFITTQPLKKGKPFQVEI